jgi:hypothetical protein
MPGIAFEVGMKYVSSHYTDTCVKHGIPFKTENNLIVIKRNRQ